MSADRKSILKSPTGVAGTVAYTGTAGSITQAVRGTCVRVWCTTDAYVAVGAAATTLNGTQLQAFETLWLPLDSLAQGEQGIIASAIQIASGGTLYARQFSE